MYKNLLIGVTCGVAFGYIAKQIFRRYFKHKSKKKTEEIPESKAEPDLLPVSAEDTYKIALVVNNELKMTNGKILAQCSHAVVAIYEKFYDRNKRQFAAWEIQGQQITIYKASDTDTLISLYNSAKKKGFYAYLIADAGRTQIASGSRTVLAIGPEKVSALRSMVDHLPSF